MIFYVSDHQHKSVGLCAALISAGHKLAHQPDQAEAVLVDYPVAWHPNRNLEIVQEAHAQGKPCFEYPHGAPPPMQYDGVAPACKELTASLVHSEGHAELMRRIEYPVPTSVVGWYYCKLKPETHPAEIGSILYAPAHPWADGVTNQEYWYDANRRSYHAILDHPAPVKTVRFYGTLAANGLTPEPGVTLVRARLEQIREQVKQIDQHDLVVSDGTFAYLAVARGKPTIMLGQDRVWHNDQGTLTVNVERWETYRQYMRWPYDLDDGDFPDVAEAARAGGERAHEWRHLFVGDQLDPEELSDTLEQLCRAAA